MSLAGALRYKPVGSRVDSRWCHWKYVLTYFFRPHSDQGSNQPPAKVSTRSIFWVVKAACVKG